jgi:hypothetical protein
MIVRLALAGVLVVHGVIHVGFVTTRPAPTAGAPPWPFDLDRSWLLTRAGVSVPTARLIGRLLVTVAVAAFLVSALGALAWLPAAWFGLAAAVGAVASLVLLLAFFHPWLVIGVAIDVVLLWGVVVAGWMPGNAPG